LKDILAELGDRRICIAREMTKMFEEFWRGNISGAIEYFNAQPARGEFTIVIEGEQNVVQRWTESELEAAIRSATEAGKKSKQVAAELAESSGWTKKEIYQKIINP